MLRKRTENEKIGHNYSAILGLISGKQARFNIHVQFRLQCGLMTQKGSFMISLPINTAWLVPQGFTRPSGTVKPSGWASAHYRKCMCVSQSQSVIFASLRGRQNQCFDI
jgi:hypothetical protein